MIQVGENRRITGMFSAIVAVIAWAVALTVAGLFSISDVLVGFRHLTIATTSAVISGFLLNRFMWRWHIFKVVLGVPDLNGRWEGWYYRSTTKEWRPCAMEISQQALDISANAWGPDNWSRGICASIVQDRFGTVNELIWAYKTEPKTPDAGPGDTHTGTHFLCLSERGGRKYLEGGYATNRLRTDGSLGSAGYHRLVWVSPVLKTALDYEEVLWGMPKPEVKPCGAAEAGTK